MSRNDVPRVSIGLPVYNGERYLREAVDSILEQTFTAWELFISDNHSDDATPDICREYIQRDSRIRYVRHEQNRGAAWNFNFVFRESRSEYFKWAAHDDILGSTYLEECVALLDRDATVVVCFPRVITIDERGDRLEQQRVRTEADCDAVSRRFYEMTLNNTTCEEVFGLMRRDVLRKTRLIGSYAASDCVLLAELALHGRFRELLEASFYHRDHPRRFTRHYVSKLARDEWFAPARKSRLFLHWFLFAQYLAAIRRSKIGYRQRIRCYMYMPGWMFRYRWGLRDDVLLAGRRLFRMVVRGESAGSFAQHIERETNQAAADRERRKRAVASGLDGPVDELSETT